MRNTQIWQADWPLFILAAAECFDEGDSESDVTSRFCDVPVRWTGTVTRIILDEDPSVQLSMPLVTRILPSGLRLTVDYLNLFLDAKDVPSWLKVTVGDSVKFQTHIPESNGSFSGLQWSTFKRDACILISTRNAVLLDIVGTRT